MADWQALNSGGSETVLRTAHVRPVAMGETKNPELVKEAMGHESVMTTMGYLHRETAQIKVVIDPTKTATVSSK